MPHMTSNGSSMRRRGSEKGPKRRMEIESASRLDAR